MRLKRLLQSLTILIFLGFSASPGCAVRQIHIDPDTALPVRPSLEPCPTDPGIHGRRESGQVVLSLQDAQTLRKYIQALRICAFGNKAILEGHIEKLENRLRALGVKGN
jgi:hypothetical protein